MQLRIREMREDHDLTQAQVSEKIMCDQSLYSKYERGVRSTPLEVMVRLAALYHTSIDYLTGLTDKKDPY